jgi:hypothetical protein
VTFGTKTVSQAFIFPSRLRKRYGGPQDMRDERERRDWRDERDGQNEGGAQSVHVSPVALDVPVARLRALADCFSILLKRSMFGRKAGTQTLTGRS